MGIPCDCLVGASTHAHYVISSSLHGANPFRAPRPVPILISSICPKNGFPVIETQAKLIRSSGLFTVQAESG